MQTVVANLREGWYGARGGSKGIVNCNGMIETAIRKANERILADKHISGTTEAGIMPAEGCEVKVSIDEIGRCMRRMCVRALAARAAGDEEEAPATAAAAVAEGDDNSGDDESDEDDDDDDEIDEEIM